MNQNPYSVSDHQSSGDVQSLGPKLDQPLRVMQIIAAALMMGVLMFFGVVLVITRGNIFGQGDPGIVAIVAAGFAGLTILNHLVIPGLITKSRLNQLRTQQPVQQASAEKVESLLGIYQTHLIITLALLEGAAFFNLVALIMDNHLFSVIAVVVLLALMAIRFPTKTKVSWWVQDRMRELT